MFLDLKRIKKQQFDYECELIKNCFDSCTVDDISSSTRSYYKMGDQLFCVSYSLKSFACSLKLINEWLVINYDFTVVSDDLKNIIEKLKLNYFFNTRYKIIIAQ